jgi:hypothetical protein
VQAAAEQVPVEVELGLAAACPDVDDDAVVVEAGVASRLRDEVEHRLRLGGRELVHVAERVDMTARQDEEVGVRLRVDVADRDEAVRRRDVVALVDESAEQAVLRQRGSPPR